VPEIYEFAYAGIWDFCSRKKDKLFQICFVFYAE